MNFARRAVHFFHLLKKKGDVRVEGTAIDRRILLPVSLVCCCSLDVQKYNGLIRAREEYVIKRSSFQGTSEGAGVLTCGLVVQLLDKL